MPDQRGDFSLEPTTNYLADVAIILLAAIVGVALAHRLRLGPIVGYLATGLIVGPAGLNLLSDIETARGLAELGVAFLLFTVGLELPIGRLRVMPRAVYVLGVAQIAFTGVLLGGIAMLRGLDIRVAVVIGLALSLSSTAIVLPLLVERRELSSRFGRGIFGILMLQDLAVGPLLVVLPSLRGDAEDIGAAIGLSIVKAIMAAVVILGAGRLLLRPVMVIVAATRVREVFAALTILIVIAAASATHLADLSMALGALLAGVLLADSAFRHQVAAEIEPFRNLLLGLFFMTIGMLLQPEQLAANWLIILLIVPCLIIVKAAILFPLARWLLLTTGPAFRLALVLSQGGEFALVLFGEALRFNLLPGDLQQALVISVVISMMLTPALAWLADWLVPKIGTRSELEQADLATSAPAYARHVILAGYGRVGRTVAARLQDRGIPWIAIDNDPYRVARERREGHPVFFGAGDRIEILESVGLADAQALVIAIDNPKSALQLAAAVHYILPQMLVVARAYDDAHAAELRASGVDVAIPEPSPISERIADAVLEKIDPVVA
ncbi:MAG TPA: cation:proton antiporter [Dongiaceae bacterium]